ncbi:hypothetical protein ACLB2K_016006 [Fragaria x ananassa]
MGRQKRPANLTFKPKGERSSGRLCKLHQGVPTADDDELGVAPKLFGSASLNQNNGQSKTRGLSVESSVLSKQIQEGFAAVQARIDHLEAENSALKLQIASLQTTAAVSSTDPLDS